MNATNTPSETLAFLRCVLPPETGDWYCALVLDGTFRRQFFFQTIEELAACIIHHDRQGRTVYHACASFKEAGSRKAQGVAQARSLWIDLDAGQGKPYENPASAAQALGEFCRGAGLPLPVLVGSGGGVHAYWPLGESLDPEAWTPLAQGLKALCHAKGLAIDPSRTADIASVLRTPGTHNYKPELRGPDGAPAVQLATGLCQYSERNLRHALPSTTRNTGSDIAKRRSVVRAGRIIDAILARNRSDFPATYCDRIADQCAQVRAFREREAIGEPRWYACIGVTAWATDGKVKTHEWSSHDPKYSASAVDGRMARVLQLSGPTTCAKLESLNPGGCNGCPHRGKISSPIQLGEAAPSSLRPPQPEALSNVADVRKELPDLIEGFIWGPKGELTWVTEDNSGKTDHIHVTKEPLYLAEVQRSEVGRPRYSYLFRHCLPQEGWKFVSIDAEQMFASNALAQLAKQGIVIHDPKMFFFYVRHTVSSFHQTNSTGTRYDQFGWKAQQTQFFIGKFLYTPAGKVTVTGGNEVGNRAALFGPQRPGASLVVWTEAADALFGTTSLPLGVCILASFAAPLLSLLLNVNGGCIIHLYSGTSGAGKSWALDGAASVWGARKALMLLNEDTKVAKPIVMGVLCNLPILYDEFFNKDPEVIKQLVNAFSDGQDRLRGTQDGGTRQVAAEWRTLMISNSNHDTIELLDTRGVDAPGYRVLQLSCPQVDFNKELGAQLKRRLEENCGAAGDKYLQYLVNPEALASVRKMLDHFHQQVWHDTGLDPAHRYRVAAVAAILVAAVVTRHLDLLHFDIDRIRDYLIKELVDPTNQGSVSSINPAESAQFKLADFLNQHLGEILTVSDRFHPGRGQQPCLIIGNAPRGRVSGRYEVATKKLYVSETVFREWCVKNQIGLREIVKELQKANIVIDPKRKITLTSGTPMVGAQGVTIEMNAEHPALSGVMTSIERLVTKDQEIKNENS